MPRVCSTAGMAAQSVRRLAGALPAAVTVGRGPRDPRQVARLFEGMQWWLHADGRLLVVPAPGLARDDLFPLPGEYWGEGLGLSFVASRRVPTVAVGMSGQLRPGAGGWSLAMTYQTRTATGTTLVDVAQSLREPTGLDYSGGDGAVGLPAVYRGRLSGTAGAAAFAGLPVEIRVLPSAGADPVAVVISEPPSAAGFGAGQAGDLMWLATSELAAAEGARYSVVYTGAEVAARLDAAAGSMTVTWAAESAPPVGRAWSAIALPVSAVTAELRLRLGASRVRGEVRGTGLLMGSPIGYAAAVDGERVDDQRPNPDQAFDLWWGAANGSIRP